MPFPRPRTRASRCTTWWTPSSKHVRRRERRRCRCSVLTAFYTSDGPERSAIVKRLAFGDSLHAPAHLDAEIASALRGLSRRNPKMEVLAPGALRHLAGFAIRRTPLAPLLERIWELRANITPYDAAYVALAERIDARLITCDVRLTRAAGCLCAFEVIG